MKIRIPLFVALITLTLSCAPATPPPTTAPAAAGATTDPTSLQSLHVRLTIDPTDGVVTYLGWYDGRRNLLGQHGITAAIVGIEPPDLHGQLSRVSPNELVFEGTDQNQILWSKRFRLEDRTVHVTYKVTNRRDQPFDAIVYSLADLPDAIITGDNRDQLIQTPIASARFHATIDDPHFPGEQMNPYALRSDSRRLQPGDSVAFQMTWELMPARPQ